jgi:predicted RNA-binding Zn-ribbon protein involved in translation (DUF1610 family)
MEELTPTAQTEEVNVCNTCASEFFVHTSKMKNICPECAHLIYNHKRCFHKFENERCSKCYWNGKTSAYALKLKQKALKKQKNARINVLIGIIFTAISFIQSISGLLFGGISYWGLFGLLIFIPFLMRSIQYKKQLDKEYNIH